MHIVWTGATRAVARRGGAVIGAACLLWSPAFAAEPAPAQDFALTVSPTRLVVPADGLDQPQYLQVTDRGRLPLDVDVRKTGFVQLRDGSPQFQANAPYSAVNWVKAVPDHFHLEPGKSQQVTVQITVPELPEPGDHQVALISSVAAPDTGSNIRVNRGIGVALYITVPGAVKDSVDFTGFQTPGFALNGPIDFTATIRQAGTVHHDFSGTGLLNIRVGGETVAFPSFLVTRGSTRVVTARWTNPPFLCVCHATASITTSDGHVHRVSSHVVIFPFHVFIVVLLVLAALYLIALRVRRGYRARVLAEALSLSQRE